MKTNTVPPQGSGIRAFLFCSAFCMLAVLASRAGAQQLQLSQFGHTGWRVEEGIFPGTPQAIRQTTDGYLWIGTSVGILRFDGVRFTPWSQWPAGREPQSSVYDLLGAKDGSLWIASSSGLARIQDGKLTYLPALQGRTNALAEASDGSIWVSKTRTQQPLCHIDHGQTTCFGKQEGLLCESGQSVSADRTGGAWLGSNSGLCHWGRGLVDYHSPNGQEEQRAQTPAALGSIDLPGGGRLVGYGAAGPHFGLQRLSAEGKWTAFDLPGLHGARLAVTTLMTDSSGDIWIGTAQEGIYHVSGGKADHFGESEGLSSDSVNSLFEDHEGNVWAATTGGIDSFRRLGVVSFSSKQGFVSNAITTVAVSPEGAVASGGRDGIQILTDGKLTLLHSGKELPTMPIVSLLYDHAGTLWAGTAAQVGKIVGNQFQPLPDGQTKDGLFLNIVEDSNHQIWVRGGRRIYKVEQGKLVDTDLPLMKHGGSIVADPQSGFWMLEPGGRLTRQNNGRSEVLFPGSERAAGFFGLLLQGNGGVWAYGQLGLRYWDGRGWLTLNSTAGLPCDVVYKATEDHQGNVWIYQRCGISVIANSELQAWGKKLQPKVHSKLFIGQYDGAFGDFDDFNPDSAVSPDGRLWFANDGPLQMVDPKKIPSNSIPPPVHIEQVLGDHTSFALGQTVSLPAHTRDLEFDYAAVSFVTPQRVRFRYKLSGVDKDWQDVGIRRQAFYMNLPPGTYTFQVLACNNDDVWNLTGAKILVSIAPAYYQTLWFRILSGLCLAAALWAAYALRLRAATANLEGRLLERYSERERIARELHDTLLQGFQAIVLNFQVGVDALPAGSAPRQMLERALESADGVLLSGRDRIRGLRSKSNSATLRTELETAISELKSTWQQNFRLEEIGHPRLLREAAQIEILAIVREALTNAAKHAGASLIVCEVTYEKSGVRVLCSDDGAGISVDVLNAGGKMGRFGLLGMRERARTIGAGLEIRNGKQEGTVVLLTLGSQAAFQS